MPRFEGEHGVWVFVYGAIGLVLLVAFARPILAMLRERHTVALLIGGGFATLVAGGVAVEIAYDYGLLTGPLQTLAEETLEMIGES